MIPFDFRLFATVVRKAFRGPPHLGFFGSCRLLLSLGCYLFLEFSNAFCLFLDEIFFPGYRRVEIKEPVFIIGNPRSGTTFLHRILSRDDGRFFVFKTWEILFPSVLQKKIGSFIGRIDRAIGSPVGRIIVRCENKILGQFQELHPTGLFRPEEDEMLFLHCFATLYLIFLFRAHDEIRPFADFDRAVSPERRARLMRYYRSCLQRQGYARGADKIFLSKNPMFSGKIATLHETFPGARFVYLVRNPLDAVPSMLSEGHASCVYAEMGSLPDPGFQEDVFEAAKIFYRRPLEFIDGHPQCVSPVIVFRDLVKNPLETVAQLYDKLGYTMTGPFHDVLEEEQGRSRAYRSTHDYSGTRFTITADRIVAELGDVFDRFGFPLEKGAPPATAGERS